MTISSLATRLHVSTASRRGLVEALVHVRAILREHIRSNQSQIGDTFAIASEVVAIEIVYMTTPRQRLLVRGLHGRSTREARDALVRVGQSSTGWTSEAKLLERRAVPARHSVAIKVFHIRVSPVLGGSRASSDDVRRHRTESCQLAWC